MSRIRGKNTGPELRLRRALWSAGRRYRVQTSLPGRPDIVFPAAKLVVFVDGCFWHSCPQHGAIPKSNQSYWEPKLTRTRQRDEEVTIELTDLGWRVRRFWEHEIADDLGRVVAVILDELG